MTVETRTAIIQRGEVNPALEKLRAWCRLNYHPKETIGVLCPYCSSHTTQSWQQLYSATDHNGNACDEPTVDISHGVVGSELEEESFAPWMRHGFRIEWMQCRNQECLKLIVRISEYVNNNSMSSWLAIPKTKRVTVDPIVPPPLAQDYEEAWLILDDSPRMSSVLSRRILGDLLKQYAGTEQYNLSKRIDNFIDDKTHPSRLRENLHYLREIGDFAAHTMTDTSQEIIDVTKEEAEWALKVVADLFDYFIIGPEKDKKLRAEFNKKMERAGRKPILPPGQRKEGNGKK